MSKVYPETYRRSLMKFSQFVLNRETEDVRSDLCKSLIETALFILKGRYATLDDINQVLSKEYAIGKIEKIPLETSLEQLVQQKRVVRRAEAYSLSDERQEEISESIEKRRELETRITDSLIEIVEAKYGPLSQEQKNETKEIFLLFLAAFFTQSSVASAETLVGKYEKRRFPVEDALKTFHKISSGLKDSRLTNALRSAIIEFLSNLADPDITTYLYDTFQNYIFFEVLSLDPECRALETKALSDITMYLDTNFILDLLLPTRERHQLAIELVRLCNSIGAKLKFTSYTKREFLSFLFNSEETFRSLSSSVSQRGLKKISALDGGFIRDFARAKSSKPALTFGGYSAKFRKALEKILANNFQIEYDDARHSEIYKDATMYDFEFRVSQCAHAWNIFKDKDVKFHDAFHLLLIKELRKKSKGGIFGPNFWFVTFDNSLYCVSRTVRPKQTPPLSVMGDIWLHILTSLMPLKVLTREESHISMLFLRFCASSLSIPFPRLKLQKLRLVAGPWIEYEWLSTKDIVDVVSHKFVRDYIEDTQELIEKGKSPEPPDEVVAKALDKTMAKKIKKLERESATLRNKLEGLIAMKMKDSADKKKLANELNALQTRLSEKSTILRRDRVVALVFLLLFLFLLDLYLINWWQLLVEIEVALLLGIPGLIFLWRWVKAKSED